MLLNYHVVELVLVQTRDVVSALFEIVAFKFCGMHTPTPLQFLKRQKGGLRKHCAVVSASIKEISRENTM